MSQTQKVHRQKTCVSLETMEQGEEYAITLSPPDARNSDTAKANSVTSIQDYDKKLTTVKELINKLHGSKLVLFPELSPTGRLHFHGILVVVDIFNFYWHDLYLLDSVMYEVDTISERDKWLNYCQKQSHIMGSIHDRLGIKYPIESGYHKVIKVSQFDPDQFFKDTS